MAKGTFRSLKVFNYRVWAVGSLVSNVGTWMQRTAQDWLVLTELTHHNATAVGIVMALQFGPQLLLLPLTGYAADHFDRRKLLFATQTAWGSCARRLAFSLVTGLVRLWQVDVFAFLLRLRHRLRYAGTPNLRLRSCRRRRPFQRGGAEFHIRSTPRRWSARRSAGILIAAVGSGWVFLINAASFGAVLASLALLRGRSFMPAPARAAPAAISWKAFAMSGPGPI